MAKLIPRLSLAILCLTALSVLSSATQGIAQFEQEPARVSDRGAPSPSVAERITQYEEILEHYFKVSPVTNANIRSKKIVEQYNAWLKEAQAAYKVREDALLQEQKAIQALDAQIVALDEKLDTLRSTASGKGNVAAYNSSVDQRNALVSRQNKMAKELMAKWAVLQKSRDELDSAVAAESAKVDKAQEELRQHVERYKKWRSDKRDVDYYHVVNRLYAELQQKRQADGTSRALSSQLRRIRTIRRDLAERAIRREAAKKPGMILVWAKLNNDEECCMMVDTGASIITIPESIVSVLGLTDQVGEEITVSLAGGIRVKARELVIPSISVFGQEAVDVDAVVLDEPMPGVDGLLGLSFLDRFAYRIDQTTDPKLSLDPKE